MSRQHVHVAGAGLCGSLLSILLARRGFEVTVLERQQDPRTHRVAAGRSINLALASRGIEALRRAEVFEPVEKLLVPMRGRMIHHPDGSTELQPYGSKSHERIYSVSRAQLNRILLDRAEQQHGVAFCFDAPVSAFDAGSGTLTLQSGETLAARPLIAADGAGSVLRRAYDGKPPIEPREELLPHGYKELTLPPAADGGFRLDPGALHIWPRGGFMLIALPNPAGDFTLTLFLPNQGEPSFATLDSDDAVERFFAREFGDIRPQLPRLCEEFAANPVGILGTVRCRRWHDGQLLLIGDAAHAIVPFHGQGMNAAFEDCAALDGLLDDDPDWRDVFRRFEQARIANANAIADMALDNYVEMRDRVRDPQFVLMKALAFELERRLPTHLVPRYSMVMFHPEIPYAVAQERGARQQALMREILAGADSLDDIDLDQAAAHVQRELPPLPA